MSNVDAEDLIARLSGGLDPTDRAASSGAAISIRHVIRAIPADTRQRDNRASSSATRLRVRTVAITAVAVSALSGERRGVLGPGREPINLLGEGLPESAVHR